MTGEQFKAWRQQQNLTQVQVAALLGVHEDTISNWERDKTRIPRTIDFTVKFLKQRKLGHPIRKGCTQKFSVS